MKKDTKFYSLLILQLLTFSFVVGLVFFKGKNEDNKNVAQFREAASKLNAAGVLGESIKWYERYLLESGDSNENKAKIAFSVAELNEKQGDLERALSWYYQVKIFDSSSKYVQDSSAKIVAILEKLQKYSAAKMELTNNTSLDQTEIVQGAKVVAELPNRKIYDFELREYSDTLPPNVKEAFKGPQGKQKLVQQYVANELMYEKAKRMQLDKTVLFNKAIEKVRKQVLLEQFFKSEIEGKISVADVDIENYFKANKERFSKNEQVKIVEVKYKDKKVLQEIKSALNKNTGIKTIVKKFSQQKYSEKSIEKGKPFESFEQSKIDQIFKVKKGVLTAPILSKGMYSVFYILEKLKAFNPNFKQVKPQVTQAYKMEKAGSLYQDLIQNEFKTSGVKLLMENFQ